MKPELFPAKLKQGLAKLSEGLAPQTVNQVLMDAVFDVARGNEINIEAVVSKTGMAPDKAAEFMEAGLTALLAQADGALKAMQVDPQQFVQWAMQGHVSFLERFTLRCPNSCPLRRR